MSDKNAYISYWAKKIVELYEYLQKSNIHIQYIQALGLCIKWRIIFKLIKGEHNDIVHQKKKNQ